jgi:hypothetical protein
MKIKLKLVNQNIYYSKKWIRKNLKLCNNNNKKKMQH